MTETKPQSHDIDEAIRQRILERAAAINEKLLLRLITIAQHINEGNNRDVLSGLRGLERRIYAMRSLLLLLN